jgi:hypothetical protein
VGGEEARIRLAESQVLSTAHNQLAFFVGTSPNPYVAVLEGTIFTPGSNKE